MYFEIYLCILIEIYLCILIEIYLCVLKCICVCCKIYLCVALVGHRTGEITVTEIIFGPYEHNFLARQDTRLAPSLSLARGKGKGRRERLVKLDRISIVL